MEKIIEFINVFKEYKLSYEKSKTALDNINLTINQGDFIGVLGLNASGKTTLARLMNGLLQPTSGKVLVKGMDTSNSRNLREIRHNVGMVFQNPDNQIISSIVEEDIAFGPENLNLPVKEIRERVDWAIDVLDLKEQRYMAPHLLSGGQKQRVAVASALAMKPSCLVLDEPTSMLDQKARKQLLLSLTMLNNAGITIIIITHNIEDVRDVNRLIVLSQGKVCLDGSPGKVFSSNETLTRLGFVSPDIIRIVNDLRSKGYNLPSDIMKVNDLVEYICRI